MRKKNRMSIEELKSVLDYDPASGQFTWKVRVNAKFPAGAIAGKKNPKGYVFIRYKGEDHTAQKLAWAFMKGEWADGPIRFQNGDRRDLRFENLYPSIWLKTKYDHSDPAQRSAYGKEKRRLNPEHYRDKQLQKDFGIGLTEYAKIHATQDGKCAVCRQEETLVRHGKVIPLSVDHNHETDVVRGLLCTACNQGLGNFKESRESLAAAIRYLDLHEKHTEADPLKVVSIHKIGA